MECCSCWCWRCSQLILFYALSPTQASSVDVTLSSFSADDKSIYQLRTDWISAHSIIILNLCHQRRLALRTLDVSWRLARARNTDTDQTCKENKTKCDKINFFFCKWRQGVKLLNMSIWWRIKSGRLTCRCYCVLSRPIEILLYSSTVVHSCVSSQLDWILQFLCIIP